MKHHRSDMFQIFSWHGHFCNICDLILLYSNWKAPFSSGSKGICAGTQDSVLGGKIPQRKENYYPVFWRWRIQWAVGLQNWVHLVTCTFTPVVDELLSFHKAWPQVLSEAIFCSPKFCHQVLNASVTAPPGISLGTSSESSFSFPQLWVKWWEGHAWTLNSDTVRFWTGFCSFSELLSKTAHFLSPGFNRNALGVCLWWGETVLPLRRLLDTGKRSKSTPLFSLITDTFQNSKWGKWLERIHRNLN